MQGVIVQVLQEDEQKKLSVTAYLRLNSFPEEHLLPPLQALLKQTADSLQVDTPAVSDRFDVRCLALVTGQITLTQFLRGRRPVNLLRAVPITGLREHVAPLVNDLIHAVYGPLLMGRPVRWPSAAQAFFEISPELMFTWVTLADRREFKDIETNLRALAYSLPEKPTPSTIPEQFALTLLEMMWIDIGERRDEPLHVISEELQVQLRDLGLSKHLRFLTAWAEGDLVLIAGQEPVELQYWGRELD